MLRLKISLDIGLPPPSIRRRRLPGVYPMIKPEMNSARKPKPRCSFGCAKEDHKNKGDRSHRICNLNLLSDGDDVQHHIHAKEDKHLSEIRKSEEGKDRHHGNHKKRQEVPSRWQAPTSSPEMPICIGKHSAKAQKKQNLHAFPRRRLTQELTFPTYQNNDSKWNQGDEPERQRVSLKPQQCCLTFEDPKTAGHCQKRYDRNVSVYRGENISE